MYIHNNTWMFHKWKSFQSFRKLMQRGGHWGIFYVVSLRGHAGILFSGPTHRGDNFMGKHKLPTLPQERDAKIEQTGWHSRNFKSQRCSPSLRKNSNVYVYLKKQKTNKKTLKAFFLKARHKKKKGLLALGIFNVLKRI